MIIMTAVNRQLLKIDTLTRGGRFVFCSRYRCQKKNATMTPNETTMSTGIQGAVQPTTFPSVKANISARSPHVIRVAPIQSTAAVLDRRLLCSGRSSGGGAGMQKTPATAIMPAMMARAPKTHFQLAHSAMRPETRLPQTLPRGAPAAGVVSKLLMKYVEKHTVCTESVVLCLPRRKRSPEDTNRRGNISSSALNISAVSCVIVGCNLPAREG